MGRVFERFISNYEKKLVQSVDDVHRAEKRFEIFKKERERWRNILTAAIRHISEVLLEIESHSIYYKVLEDNIISLQELIRTSEKILASKMIGLDRKKQSVNKKKKNLEIWHQMLLDTKRVNQEFGDYSTTSTSEEKAHRKNGPNLNHEDGPMESMMDGMMSPFGFFGGHGAIDSHGQQVNRSASHSNMFMPFGFGPSLFSNVNDMFTNYALISNPNCHSFSSSPVMTYTTDEIGSPQVYQASSSTRTAAGGVNETRHSVQDSRAGLQEMAIGHHLNERGHVVEKKKNRCTLDEKENYEFINLDDDEADQFNQEWQQEAQTYPSYSHGQQVNRSASHSNMFMPFGFGPSLFSNVNDMTNFAAISNPNCHSFSSSPVMTYTTDEIGRPQVYQAFSSTRTAAGEISSVDGGSSAMNFVKETSSRSVEDIRAGLQEMDIGHLNERGHVVEKKKTRYTLDEKENHEFINLDDDEADQFNQEWQQKAQAYLSGPMRAMLGYDGQRRTHSPLPEILAITEGIMNLFFSESNNGKKKGNKPKCKHGAISGSRKTSRSHPRPAPYQ